MEKLRVELASDSGVLFRGDCLSLLAMMKDESTDVIFADPPFNLGKNYGSGISDRRTDGEYVRWLNSWLEECVRVLRPGAAIFVYHLPRWNVKIAATLEMLGMTFRHWIAVQMTTGYPRQQMLYPAHYSILYFTKGPPRQFSRLRVAVRLCRHCGKEVKDYGGHRAKLHDDGVTLSDFWEDTSPVRHAANKRRGANELPREIPRRCLSMAARVGDVLLDPFAGSAGSCVEASALGIKWVASELGSCDAAREQLARISSEAPPGSWLNDVMHYDQVERRAPLGDGTQ